MPSSTIEILLNGVTETIPSGQTLQNILKLKGYDKQYIATAINHEIVRANDRPLTYIKEGDQVEILHPVGGG